MPGLGESTQMKQEIARCYRRNTMLLRAIAGDLGQDGMDLRAGNSNTLGWIIGHLAASRAGVLRLLGDACDTGDDEQPFARGSAKVDHVDIDLTAALNRFKQRGRGIIKGVEAITDDDLARKIGVKLPDGGDTIGDALSFYAWHEALHIGQIDLIRAANGRGGIE